MKRILFLLALLQMNIALAQHEASIWYFGYESGLDFTGGDPVVLTDGALVTQEGCSAIADAEGNLLFYTNGVQVFNKNHVFMDNGTGLMGHTSTTQSAIIVPKPGSTTLYYIFTADAQGGTNGLRYSAVDMALDGGFGSVTEKNVLLHTPTCEKLAAAWHSNGEDIWVVSHNFDSDVFSAYLVTENGVGATPVTSATGTFITSPFGGEGAMKISRNNTKLAVANSWAGAELFDFDNTTGAVSNPVTLLPPATIMVERAYGVEFSASGDILYVGNFYQIYQFDLLASDIAASAIEVLSVPADERIGTLQRGPDDKIYIALYQEHSLSVINNPDILGAGCNPVSNAIILGQGFTGFCYFGLPNNLAPPFRIGFTAIAGCAGTETSFSANIISGIPESVFWDFGDGSTSSDMNPSHTYMAPGIYTVKLTAQRLGVTIMVEQIVELTTLQITQPPDMEQCEEGEGTASFDLTSQDVLITGIPDSEDYTVTYHLTADEAAAGSNALPVNFTSTSSPQVIYARAEHSNGCHAVTSFMLVARPLPVIAMQDSSGFCIGGSVQLVAPEGFDGYSWSTGEATRSIEVSAAGTYILTVMELHGQQLCESNKTITVYESAAPVITEIKTTEWTDNSNTISVKVSGSGDYEYSLDGITFQDSPEFTGLEDGLYTVYVRDRNGCGEAVQEVLLLMYPKFFTPNGDGFYDTWRIRYSQLAPKMVISIFDRYGKMLTSFEGDQAGWDGKHNNTDLPATDYWFVISLQDGQERRGHFSLVR